MISRRSILLAPAAVASAQSRKFDVLVVWTTLRAIPSQVARESIVFPRAYVACPDETLARRAFETGKFPHALRPGDTVLPYRQLMARSQDETVQMALSVAPGTLVIVTSLAQDDTHREESIRVPLAVRWPGMIVTRNAPEVLVSHVDLMPTIYSLAGAPVPSSAQGRDLARVLTAKTRQVPDSVYAAGDPAEWRVLIRGFDKLVFTLQEEVTGLYNLADDPDERNNLAREPSQELARDAMLALARVWMRRLEDGRDSSGAKRR